MSWSEISMPRRRCTSTTARAERLSRFNSATTRGPSTALRREISTTTAGWTLRSLGPTRRTSATLAGLRRIEGVYASGLCAQEPGLGLGPDAKHTNDFDPARLARGLVVADRSTDVDARDAVARVSQARSQ